MTQVNPFNLCSGLKIGQLGAGFTGGSCPNDQLPSVNFGHNDLKMFNLTLNKFNPCWPVLIAGTGMKRYKDLKISTDGDDETEEHEGEQQETVKE